jgi:FkbM family methyltransferase
MRNLLRNAVLAYLPPPVAHRINMLKNVQLSFLEEEMRVVPALVLQGSVVVDVGANLGLYCEIFARKAGRVLAFEPQPQLAQYLRRVLPAHVTVVECALSAAEGETTLRVPRMSKGRLGGLDAFGTIEPANDLNAMQPDSVDEITVAIRRLDDVVPTSDRVSMIKIDVEGHEVGVVQGALGLIRRDRPALMIEIEPRHNAASYDLFDLFAQEGYQAYCLDKGDIIPVGREEAGQLQHWINGDQKPGGPANFAPHVANFFFVGTGSDAQKALLAFR